MIRQLVHDPLRLGRKSAPATKEDLPAAQDLLETLMAHKDTCVGMAANMIGVQKQIIAFDNNGIYMLMLNPEIVDRSDPYETEESCLSLLGGPRRCLRYRTITVKWQRPDLQPATAVFTGFTAQIIQHEVDHCRGILI